MTANSKEKVARKISAMGSTILVRMLRGLNCSFELDFTDDFFDSVSLERLRHIAVAASMHTQDAGSALAQKRRA